MGRRGSWLANRLRRGHTGRSRPSWIRNVGVIAALLLVLSSTAITDPMRLDAHQNAKASQPFTKGPVGLGPRLVFAHYFPPYPISIDNKDSNADFYATSYLTPDGLNGAYVAFGGMLRDRPLPRTPRPEADWRQLDLAEEVRQASSAGIDGFSIDILTAHDSHEWIAPIPTLLLQVAEKVNPHFRIMLMPDMNGELGTLTPQELASEMSRLAASPSAFRLADGRLVVAPYKAENLSVEWWREFIAAMKAQHGQDVALVPVFLEVSVETIAMFSPITFGMSAWGGRNPAFNPIGGFPLDPIRRVHEMKQLWMQPVSVQDYRPSGQMYDEAENTTNLRHTWQIAIEGRADWVQIVTWNDYSENSGIAPSVRHGWALLEICSYYIRYFKERSPPPIQEDRVFLTHRTQLIGAAPTSSQTHLAHLRVGSTPGRDAVEALSFLTAPSTVTVAVGPSKTACAVPAGVSTCVAPIGKPGPAGSTVSVDVSRDNRSVVDLVSPYKIAASPSVQDLSYAVAGSHRTGS